jgi:hypothetical protein
MVVAKHDASHEDWPASSPSGRSRRNTSRSSGAR